jgi:hypothetical protein
MHRIFLIMAVAAFALYSQACTNVSSCSRGPDSVTIALGDNSGAVEGNTYHSAPYGGPYAYFPPARTITFEHGLAAVPYAMQFWLAFSANGTLAPSAGNMTELTADAGAPALNDQTISVNNNTCSDFYLWVVAQRSTP